MPIIAVLVVSFAPAFARGQANKPAIGTEVVPRPGAVLKVGARVVETGKTPHIDAVERTNDEWLLLAFGTIRGWTNVSGVIPLDRAIDETVVALINRGRLIRDSGVLIPASSLRR
jgi:hypothetical protein